MLLVPQTAAGTRRVLCYPDCLFFPFVFSLARFVCTNSRKWCWFFLTLLELQYRFRDNPLKFEVVCPQNGTAVLKGLTYIPGSSFQTSSQIGYNR